MSTFPTKPLGQKSYGTIAHLPGSRQGRDDVGIDKGQARIATEKPRDKKDRIIVQEKLDGSNVAVACVLLATGETELIPLIRAGYAAVSSKYEQHRLFHLWAMENIERFAFLKPGERVAGEWLAQAHGTRYDLRHGPFVAFDILRRDDALPPTEPAHQRAPYDEFVARVKSLLPIPECIFNEQAKSCSIEAAMKEIDARNAHGAKDPIEGAVWRVERAGAVDFLAKFVRHGKVDGKFLPELNGGEAVWNWRPSDKRTCPKVWNRPPLDPNAGP